MAIGPIQATSRLIEDLKSLQVTEVWRTWFRSIRDSVNRSPQVVGSAHFSARAVALGPILKIGVAPTLVAGVYRVTVQIRVTKADAVSSAVRHGTTWTDGGVVQARLGTNVTGNTTTSYDSDTFLVRIDDGTAIDIETIYSSFSAPPNEMQYEIDAYVESLPDASAA